MCSVILAICCGILLGNSILLLSMRFYWKYPRFYLEDEESIRSLFSTFTPGALDYSSSHYECWGGDGGRGLYGRTFYVDGDPQTFAQSVVEYLLSKGFPAEVNNFFTSPSVRSDIFGADWLGIAAKKQEVV